MGKRGRDSTGDPPPSLPSTNWVMLSPRARICMYTDPSPSMSPFLGRASGWRQWTAHTRTGSLLLLSPFNTPQRPCQGFIVLYIHTYIRTYIHMGSHLTASRGQLRRRFLACTQPCRARRASPLHATEGWRCPFRANPNTRRRRLAISRYMHRCVGGGFFLSFFVRTTQRAGTGNT